MRQISTLFAGLAMAAGAAATLAPVAALHAQEATAAAAAEVSAAERELFALNLYHEARSEGRDGMIAVGWVVLNRVESEAFPDSITAVINEPTRRGCQWGWTCDGRSDAPTEQANWEMAQEVTELMLSDARPADPTEGAVVFHETFRATPGWLRGATRTVTLNNHHFYRLN
jgi:N-acetylmuramoyl-L-alanine amidase